MFDIVGSRIVKKCARRAQRKIARLKSVVEGGLWLYNFSCYSTMYGLVSLVFAAWLVFQVFGMIINPFDVPAITEM